MSRKEFLSKIQYLCLFPIRGSDYTKNYWYLTHGYAGKVTSHLCNTAWRMK
jgi:hypothetical protein